jgi:hypothetical protein
MPRAIDIDRVSLARALTGSEDFATAVLPTGRYHNEIISATVVWLRNEGFTHNQGSTPWDSVSLSGKCFVALNIVPPGFKGTLGEALHAVDSRTRKQTCPAWETFSEVCSGDLQNLLPVPERAREPPVAMKRVEAAQEQSLSGGDK